MSDIRSKPSTPEYRANFDAIFRRDRNREHLESGGAIRADLSGEPWVCAACSEYVAGGTIHLCPVSNPTAMNQAE